MEFTNFICTADDNDRRIDRVVRRIMPHLPLAAVYKNIRSGFVRLNGKKTASDVRTAAGDVIGIASFLVHDDQNLSNELNKSAAADISLKMPEIQDIFKNEHIRIINKPYDIAVHGGGSAGKNQISLADSIINEYTGVSLSFKPGPLHRLDKKTTGLTAFSQSLTGARWFSAALAEHHIKKTYIAVLCGTVREKMVLENIITKSASQTDSGYYTSTVDTSGIDGKKAVSIIEPRLYGTYTYSGKAADVTFAEIVIETGRTHQIRAQCAAAGYPLLGDCGYGGVPYNEAAAAAGGIPFSASVRANGSMMPSGVPYNEAAAAAGGIPFSASVRANGSMMPSGIRYSGSVRKTGSMMPGGVPYNEAAAEDHFFLHAWKMEFPSDNPVGLPPILYAPVPLEFIDAAKKCLIDIDRSPYNETVQ